MSVVLVTLPLHLACQLLNLGNSGHGNVTMEESAISPTHTTVLPGGYTVFPDVGVAYKYHKTRMSWDSARRRCIAEGASLSIVDSFKKIEYIMEMKDPNQGTWTGVRKENDNDRWTNTKTGRPVGFIPWRPDATESTGLCIANRHDTLGVSPWNCDDLVPAICEIPIFKNEKNKAYVLAEPIGHNIP